MSACPYSHPDNPMHNLVRMAIRNSGLARRVALAADDYLYGRRPPPADVEEWMSVGTSG
jgi:hypothetical protein